MKKFKINIKSTVILLAMVLSSIIVIGLFLLAALILSVINMNHPEQFSIFIFSVVTCFFMYAFFTETKSIEESKVKS